MDEIKFINIIELQEGLKEKVRQWRNKEEIRRFMLTQHIVSKGEHLQWIEGLKHRNDWKFWVIFLKDIPIGSVYLQNINYEKISSEWGFYIGEEEYKRKGLSKAVLLKLLEIFFDEMKFATLFTKILSDNIVALNLYRKFKFKQIEKASFEDKREVVILGFSKEDWMKYRRQLENEACPANRK